MFLGWLIYLVWVSNVDLVSWAHKKSKALLPIAENEKSTNTSSHPGAQALDSNRIITLKQKSKIVDILLTNRGSISIAYVRGDRKAEQFAEEIRDIFNTAYWHTSIDGANFAGFDRGLIVSANTISDRINVIIKAFDAGDINIKSWIDPHMKEKELELKVGSP
jgi:hypothetical protein